MTPEEIDPGVRSFVEALNKLPGVETVSSCDGIHNGANRGHVIFFYEGETPPWLEGILKHVEQEVGDSICLGCLRLKVHQDYHFDCANDLKGPAWWIEIIPRSDYGPSTEDIQTVWDALTGAASAAVT